MLERILAAQPQQRLFVEDVFSTWLYTGNNDGGGQAQTITNGINLSNNGGLVWLKQRTGNFSPATSDHALQSSTGGNSLLISNSTAAAQSGPISNFNTSGFTIWLGSSQAWNASGSEYASWTFRRAPRFFDVVTYTGNGAASRSISHSLGVAPGMVIVKRVDTTGSWKVRHRSPNADNATGLLNSDVGFGNQTDTSTAPRWEGFISAMDASTFTVSSGQFASSVAHVNASGGTYVAYLFAHVEGADGLIQCGSFIPSGSPVTVNLGWEPQWLLVKDTGSPNSSWQLIDNMRGFLATTNSNYVMPNSNSAELADSTARLTSSGFSFTGNDFRLYIYVAIRRGPMRTPTLGTQVFAPSRGNAGGSAPFAPSGFPPDLAITRGVAAGNNTRAADRLRGLPSLTGQVAQLLFTNLTNAESGFISELFVSYMNGMSAASDANSIFWMFRRAPGFFDIVCYTGNGVTTGRAISHNLGIAPELIIVKRRDAAGDGGVYAASEGPLAVGSLFAGASPFPANSAFITGDDGTWNGVAPTASNFTIGRYANVNASGGTFVAYLFGSVPGVSKVGFYTGNGGSQTINCGFTNGARFVLIKRANGTGNWWVWDTARGIVSGNEPALNLDTTAAEAINDELDPDSSGFVVNQGGTCNINVSGGRYIYLAIA